MKIVVLYSGGLDSTVLLYLLKSQGAEISALGFNYGQKHSKELDAAYEITNILGINFEIINIDGIKPLLLNNSQTGDLEPVGVNTVIPNRNMILLSLASAYAFGLKYDSIGFATHLGDYVIYPDCRPDFIKAMEKSLNLAYWGKLEIYTPFLWMLKCQILTEGMKLGVPFELTRSCYSNSVRHCGKCGACYERKIAFQNASMKDNTIYE